MSECRGCGVEILTGVFCNNCHYGGTTQRSLAAQSGGERADDEREADELLSAFERACERLIRGGIGPVDAGKERAVLRNEIRGRILASRKLRSDLATARAERNEHLEIFAWLLGESGEFPESKPGARYNFRSELRKRLAAASPEPIRPAGEDA